MTRATTPPACRANPQRFPGRGCALARSWGLTVLAEAPARRHLDHLLPGRSRRQALGGTSRPMVKRDRREAGKPVQGGRAHANQAPCRKTLINRAREVERAIVRTAACAPPRNAPVNHASCSCGVRMPQLWRPKERGHGHRDLAHLQTIPFCFMARVFLTPADSSARRGFINRLEVMKRAASAS